MGVYVNFNGANGAWYTHKLTKCALGTWWTFIDSAVLIDHPDYKHDDEAMDWTYPLDAAELERNAPAARMLHAVGHPDWDTDDDPFQHAIDLARESERVGQRAVFSMEF
jgi:hypothetical protein